MNVLHEMADDMAEAAPAINAKHCAGNCRQGRVECAAEACTELGFEDDQSDGAGMDVLLIVLKALGWMLFATGCVFVVAGLV